MVENLFVLHAGGIRKGELAGRGTRQASSMDDQIDDEEAAVRLASQALYSDIHALMKQLFGEELHSHHDGVVDLAKEAVYRQLRLSEAIFVGGVISFLDVITSKFTEREMRYVEWARDEIGRQAQKRGHKRLFLKKRR